MCESSLRTELEQTNLFVGLKSSGKLLQHGNRSGFIYFQNNGYVSFFEIHSDWTYFEMLPFEDALTKLLEAASESKVGGVPDYKFEKLWVDSYTYTLSEIKALIFMNLN